MSLRIVVTETSGKDISAHLEKAAALAQNPRTPAQAAAEWMTAETFRIFEAGYNVNGPWAPISKMTGFIRRHRANSPRRSSTPGLDTGRLSRSFMPAMSDDGKAFGTGTNVEYAEGFNDGGPSQANSVAIRGFKRRNMKRVGKDYVMNLKAGHDVPARQFFPADVGELQSWGYLDKIREIFAIDFKSALGGTE